MRVDKIDFMDIPFFRPRSATAILHALAPFHFSTPHSGSQPKGFHEDEATSGYRSWDRKVRAGTISGAPGLAKQSSST